VVVSEEEEGGTKMRQTIKRGQHSIYLNLYQELSFLLSHRMHAVHCKH